MVQIEVYNLSIFQAEKFSLPGVSHGFSTRKGGNSRKPFDALNLKLPVEPHEDLEFHVLENRRFLAESLYFDADRLVACQQVHGDAIYTVKLEDQGRGAHRHLDGIAETDGLITDQVGIPLMIQVADCVPILFLAPEARVIGAVHAGWRGTQKTIVKKMIALFASQYGVTPEQILVAIGPCIGFEKFEVGAEVAQAFVGQIELSDPNLVRKKQDRFFLNLQVINQLQAEESGVPSAQIEIIPHCTYMESEHFFSYRRDHGKTGRQVGIICLN